MFGFGRLGSYHYFAHVERALVKRFADAGHELVPHVIEDLPTASIRRRATRLAEIVAKTYGGDVVHLLGHSTGGIDSRVVASPATHTIAADHLAWLPQLRSVTTMNTPHFGTPLASFFATAKGQRALALLAALTVAGLSVGKQPLAAASMLLGFVRSGDRGFPFKFQLLDRSVESVVGLVDDARSPEVRTFIDAIEDDQGTLLQLTPESMDLVAAGLGNRDGVAYQTTCSMAPKPQAMRWLDQVGHPWRTVSLSLFFALHRLTGGFDPHYTCVSASAGSEDEAMLAKAFGTVPVDANDGIVPLRSQLWGTVVWAGYADHLDVLGHYLDAREEPPVETRHRDWLTSGSNFGDAEFTALLDAITRGMLAASGSRSRG